MSDVGRRSQLLSIVRSRTLTTRRAKQVSYSGGSLTLTPDHVMFLDGEYRAAHRARNGSALSSGEAISMPRAGV